jgi:hypothetical protein
MPPRIQVVVLYRNALMGEGLAGLLRTEPRLDVSAAASDSHDDVERALARRPAVIVLENGDGEGGRDLMRRSSCEYLIEVSLISGTSQVLTAQEGADGDGLPLRLVNACLGRPTYPAEGPTGAAA